VSISICKYNGTSWNQAYPSPIETGLSSITIDKTNTPYLIINSGTWKGLVLKYSGGGWVSLGATPASPLNFNPAAIIVDSTGTPYIAYGGNLLEYNGSAWIYIESSLGFVSGAGKVGTSPLGSDNFAIGSSGKIYFEFLQGDGQTYGSSLFVQSVGCTQVPLATWQINLTNKAITLYPNPAKNEVYFSTELHNTSVRIIGEDGRVLYEDVHFSGNSINTTSLSNGFYLVQITTDKGESSFKKLLISR
ncbi:MAG TPA: T9SS type A sorting domain-containing protein, partial [Bacteroidia bacterium]|nr:T9SS type A sorting domain-containing protein [Bacteroidia bacterium]